MQITAVARIMNEEDIIEAFVRHTLAHADAMLLLDNGSTDRTVEILGALRAEGLHISVLQVQTSIFCEPQHNSFLYGTAQLAFRPDWILHLDADEFIDARVVPLRDYLARIPPSVQGVLLPLVDYFVDGLDTSELVVPCRMRLRDTVDRGTRKCMLRGDLTGQVVVDSGQHTAWIDGQPIAAAEDTDIKLAHYSVRHPITGMMKAALGRLKVLAAGGEPDLVAQRNGHYTHLLDALCRDPTGLFSDRHRMEKHLPPFAVIEDPIAYAGGPLRYTHSADPVMHALRAVANAAQQLAVSHGRLLDADPVGRDRLAGEALHARMVFT